MQQLNGSLDIIIDTVGTPHNIEAELHMLRLDGALVLLGGSPAPHPAPSAFSLILKRRTLSGSLIGGIAETQEMLDFCAQHGIVSDIETIGVDQINDAYERMLKSDVRYRFVIDLSTLQ